MDFPLEQKDFAKVRDFLGQKCPSPLSTTCFVMNLSARWSCHKVGFRKVAKYVWYICQDFLEITICGIKSYVTHNPQV